MSEFKIIEKIGQGYFSEVFLVEDKDKKLKVVKTQDILSNYLVEPFFYNILSKTDFNLDYLNILFPKYQLRKIFFERIQQSFDLVKNEFKLTQKCGDLNISPKVYSHYFCADIVECRLQSVFVMENLSGITLNTFIIRNKITPSIFKSILTKKNELESILRSLNIEHNDLHNDNIIVQKKRKAIQLKVIDFGISKSSNYNYHIPNMDSVISLNSLLFKLGMRINKWISDEELLLHILIDNKLS